MAYKSLISLVVLFVLASPVICNEAASSDVVDALQPINPKDPEVVKIADFAVKEHNKEAKTALVYKSVVEGDKNVDGSTLITYYRLVIAAKDSGAANPKNYLAVIVSSASDKSLKLIFFKPVNEN